LIRTDEEIPTIKDIVVSAWVAEAELSDLMNIKIENTSKGFVLEPDFEGAPLRKKK
jgi:NADH:ubiquinone oxidoreductase subunit C